MASRAWSRRCGGDEVGGDQPVEALVLALGGADVDLDQAQLALGLGHVGGGALQGQTGFVVFLAGEDLAGDDAVAFLDQTSRTTPPRRAAIWMMPPSTSTLPLAMAA